MPNKKSAIKRMRQNKKRYLHNKSIKNKMKTVVKSLLTAIEEKNVEKVKAQLPEAVSVLNKTAKKGIIHKGNASRRESRLRKKVNEFLKTV